MENFEPIDDLPGELGTGDTSTSSVHRWRLVRQRCGRVSLRRRLRTRRGTGDWGHFDKLSASLGTGDDSSQFPIPNPQSPIPNPQSPIPNPQSPIPNPQSPIPNPQSPIPIQETAASRRLLLIYLIPVLGFFPSLWTLYSRRGSREQLIVSRLSITLAFTWLLIYLLLGAAAETSEFFTLRLLILNSFFTSGYFLVSVWLMFRLIKNKSNRLPGFSNFAERVLGKYLP